MNCQKGDIAQVISRDLAYGYIVTCVERYDGPWRDWEGSVPGWIVDPTIPAPFDTNERCTCIPDEFLRPYRPNDGEDEILRIAHKPELCER